MNKYELALVVNAKIEDDARAEAVERVKALIERFGGVITNVDEWGKRRLAYEIQKMREGYYYFIQFDASSDARHSLNSVYVSWSQSSDIYALSRRHNEEEEFHE